MRYQARDAMGMRQLAYVPMQGEEKLFPDNLPIEMRSSSRLGRLRDAFETLSVGGVWKANPIGTGTAAEAWGSVMPPCHN